MLGIIGILAAAKRLLGVFLKINNGGLYAESAIGNFAGQPDALQLNQWNHVVMSVSSNVATFFVNGGLAGGSPGSPPPATFPSVAKLQDVKYLRNASININANSYLGANNKTFIDNSSVSSLILTTSGNLVASGVTLGSFSPYSNQEWGMQFSSTNYLSAKPTADQFAFGREDFTIEFWAYANTLGAIQQLLDLRNAAATYKAATIYLLAAGNLSYNYNGTVISDENKLPLKTWNHIALSRKYGSQTALFLNGQKVAYTLIDSAGVHEFTNSLAIGRDYTNANTFDGYISNLRIFRGSSLYNSNFTPSSQALKLLPQVGIGTRSILNPTTTSSLTSNNTTLNGMGLDNFAVEMWVYKTKAGEGFLISQRIPATSEPTFYYNVNANENVVLQTGDNDTIITSVTQLDLNTWYHLRFTRDDQGYKLYINGVFEGGNNFKEQIFLPKRNILTIGNREAGTTGFVGYISNLRLVKGSTIDYPEITSPTSRLSLEGVSATNYIGVFNGTSYVSAASPNLSTGSSDFTIECWAYLNSTATATTCATIFDMRAATTGDGPQQALVIDPAGSTNYGGRLIYFANSQRMIMSNFPIATGNWYHIALSRNSGTTSLYIDGAIAGSATDTLTYNPSSIHLGSNRNRTNGKLNGYLSNFRIVTGAAVYTGTKFERPSADLVPIPGTVLLTLQDNILRDNSIFNRTLTPVSNFVVSPQNLYEDISKDYYSIRTTVGGGISSRWMDPPMAINNSDFTVEFFVYIKSKPTANTPFLQFLDAVGNVIHQLDILANSSNFRYYVPDNSYLFTKKINTKTWYHIALVKTYNKVSFYVNGKLSKTASGNAYLINSIPHQTNVNIAPDFDGYVTEYRLVNKALYYKNFNVPNAPLPIIGEEQVYDYSGRFDGTSTFLSAGNITDNSYLLNAFTIEFWVFFNVCKHTHLLDYRTGNTTELVPVIYIDQTSLTTLRFWLGGDRLSTTVAERRWYHIALTRTTAGVYSFYSNGSLVGTYSNTTPITKPNITIGRYPGGIANLNGYISNFRIVDRVLYSGSTIPVPTSKLTAVQGTKLLTLNSNVIQDGAVVDESGNYTGPTKLQIYGDYKNSVFNPFNFDAPVKTSLLISAKNKSLSDYSPFNVSISGRGYTFYNNQQPWLVKPIRTILLTLTGNTGNDSSGHMTLSSVNMSFSAVDPFGGNGFSGVFNGTSYLSAKPINPFLADEDDFTLETWFYQTTAAAVAGYILDTTPFGGTTGGYRISISTANRITIQGQSNTTFTGPTIDILKWNHFAISRRSGEKCEFFLNKKYIGNIDGDTSTLFNPSNLVIGALNTGLSPFRGFISNFRMVKGESMYNFLNEQLFPQPIEETNEIATVPPVNYSQFLSANNSYSGVSRSLASTEFNFGLSSFTIEMWIKPRTNAIAYLWDQRITAAFPIDRFALTRRDTGRIGVGNNALFITSNVTTPINQWSHIAVSRLSGSGMSLYVNGVSAGYYNDRAISWGSDNASIGMSQAEALYGFNGLISNVRVTKNAALYSGASFSVPTSPLTVISEYPLNKYSTIFSASKKSFLYLYTKNYPGFEFLTNSFCVEFFIYSHNQNKLYTIYDSRDTSNPNGNYLKIEINSSNKVVCSVAGAAKITSTTSILPGTWYHISYQRSANISSKLYINGISEGTPYTDALIAYSKINGINIGASTSSDYFDGLLSNFRISNSLRYNNNFTVPKSDFIVDQNTPLLLFQNNDNVDNGFNQISPIESFPEGVYLTTNALNPFYPSNSARTILLTLQDSTGIKDNAGVFVEGYSFTKSGVVSEPTNPFNNPVKTELLICKTPDDFKSYGLSAFNSTSNSVANPFSNISITSFLVNGEKYKDTSTYNTPLYNTNILQRAKFATFSPFLNLSPYTSANGGSIYFDNTSTKFLLVSSKGLVTKFGTDNFTIEFWLYKNTTAASQMMIYDTMSSVSASSPGHMQIYLDAANKVVFYAGGAARITSTEAIPPFSWQHVAIARKASITTLYINGIANSVTHGETLNNAISTNFTDPGYFAIGSRLSALNTNTLSGYITDFHIVSGSCLYISNFTPPIEPLSAFANTKLLINATNAGVVDTTGKFNLFTGGSGVYISNDVPTISASASTGNLSAGSIYFDGTNNSYVYTDSNTDYFLLSAYTAELWVKPTTTPTGSAVLFSIRNTDTDKLVLAIDNNRRLVYRSTNSTAVSSITSAAIPLNQWSHIVITRALSAPSLTAYKTTLYVNGTDSGFTSAAIANTNKLLHIGSDNNNNRFTGFIDDFKIVKEVMDRYATSVTIPLRESEIQNNLRYPSVDHLEETKLLINANSTIASKNDNFIDESDYKLAIGTSGTIYQGSHTILSPGFGYNPAIHGGSIYLDGTSDVYVNDIEKYSKKPFNFINNYTIEAWVKPLNAGSNPPIFDTRKKGISARIGSDFSGNSRFKGYITGVKTSKGVSRYGNTNFTVNMIPAVSDQYTSLLLNFKNAAIYDSVSKNNIATIGNAAISREQKKFGAGGSVKFGGDDITSGDGYLAMPENSHFLVGTDDFTIEWHMFATSILDDYGIFTTVSPETSANGHLYINFKDNSLWVGIYGAYEINFQTCSGALNEWVHVAVVRENGTCRVYRNGISQGSEPFSTNINIQSGGFIGKTYKASMRGYIDEFRFTNGVCRYTQDFNPEISMSMLYDANDVAYNIDDSIIVFDPPRYPSSNGIEDFLEENNNLISVDYVLVGGGGAGGGGDWTTTYNLPGVSAGGGGGGGAVKQGSFLAQKSLLQVEVGAGGTIGHLVASTPGQNSVISGYVNDTAQGGGQGGVYFSNTVFYYAGSGANGGGAFASNTLLSNNSGGGGNTDGFAGQGTLQDGLSSAFAGHGGGAGGSSLPINFRYDMFVVNTPASIIGENGAGSGITPNLLSNKLYLSSFGGGGAAYKELVALGSRGTYTNKFGGGGHGYRNQGQTFVLWGFDGVINTGGGGAGVPPFGLNHVTSGYENRRVPGKGGSGCAIFRIPLILNDNFLTTGTTERIESGEHMFIIFKSTGTLQLI
jgi:hypothetical protein